LQTNLEKKGGWSVPRAPVYIPTFCHVGGRHTYLSDGSTTFFKSTP